MSFFRIGSIASVFCASLFLTPLGATRVHAGSSQDEPVSARPRVSSQGAGASGSGSLSLQAIHDDYARQLLQLERQRLDRLGQLAARQTPKEAAETYEQLFRLAIANNLFSAAEPAAQQVLKSTAGLPAMVIFLARTIDIIASADRGAYAESLAELRTVLDTVSREKRGGEPVTPSLDTSALIAICEAYYQRLLQGDQFNAAREAFQMLLKESENPGVKSFSAGRLNQLGMLGKPAPAIQGTDLDGKPVSLAGLKGNVVLIVFWASWCMPSAAEVATLDQLYSLYQNRGFRILGINLDTMQTDRPKLETVLPNVKRFLIDNNVRWPNLINGDGPQDYARAYGISEIPSNVLISRDGNVVHLDLSPRKNLATVVARTLGP